MVNPEFLDWDPRRPGWIAGTRRCPSPNCNARPNDTVIDLVVVHGISLPAGCFGGPHIERLFLNTVDIGAHPTFSSLDGLKVSSHFLVRRDGEVVQFVPTHLRAWHAGVSEFAGRRQCNNFSVGIEFEGADEVPYEMAQYASGRRLLGLLVSRYPSIHTGRIVAHSDVAPGRKTDPGPAFDWSQIEQI